MRQTEEDQFTAFVRAHNASLFRTAYLMTGDSQRAEDLLQTTLVRVYQRWPGCPRWTGRWRMPARSW